MGLIDEGRKSRATVHLSAVDPHSIDFWMLIRIQKEAFQPTCGKIQARKLPV
jgi:hypothetical protein